MTPLRTATASAVGMASSMVRMGPPVKTAVDASRAVWAMLRPPIGEAPARATAPARRVRRLAGGMSRVMDASFSSVVGDQIDIGAGPDGQVGDNGLHACLWVGNRETRGQEQVRRHHAEIFE